MDVATFIWTVVGVLISFVLPPLLRAAGVTPSKDDPTRSMASFTTRLRAVVTNRAVIVMVLSLILALVVTALLGEQINTWNMALISGLGWQSLLARTLAPGS